MLNTKIVVRVQLEILLHLAFIPGKILALMEKAGQLQLTMRAIALKVQMLSDHGAIKKYYHESYGHNYRMDGIQGAVLNVKLKHLESWTNCRREAAKAYNEFLKDTPEIITPKEELIVKHVYHLYVIRLRNGNKDLRDKLAEFSREKRNRNRITLSGAPSFAELFQPIGI